MHFTLFAAQQLLNHSLPFLSMLTITTENAILQDARSMGSGVWMDPSSQINQALLFFQ